MWGADEVKNEEEKRGEKEVEEEKKCVSEWGNIHSKKAKVFVWGNHVRMKERMCEGMVTSECVEQPPMKMQNMTLSKE